MVGDFLSQDGTKKCALGHCGWRDNNCGDEGLHLIHLLSKEQPIDVTEINDGRNRFFQQSTPKKRILAALYLAKEIQNDSSRDSQD